MKRKVSASLVEWKNNPKRMPLIINGARQVGKTLVFFDEIQACERALTSLKYFSEQTPEYHVVAAGSLLGVAINRKKYSFPVGKVNEINMYSFDFEEFLWAMNREKLAEEIKSHYVKDKAMPTALHEVALELYRQYFIVGGMPAVVANFIETESYIWPTSVFLLCGQKYHCKLYYRQLKWTTLFSEQ